MAWIAKFFQLVKPSLCIRFVVCNRAIDEQQRAIRGEHAGRLPHKGGGITEMMGRHAATHEVERAICIRQPLGGMLDEPHALAALASQFCALVQHARGDVRERYLPSLRGKMESGMSPACGHVERPASRAQWNLLQGKLDIGGIGQNMASAVALALTVELPLGALLDAIKIGHVFQLRSSAIHCEGVVRHERCE